MSWPQGGSLSLGKVFQKISGAGKASGPVVEVAQCLFGFQIPMWCVSQSPFEIPIAKAQESGGTRDLESVQASGHQACSRKEVVSYGWSHGVSKEKRPISADVEETVSFF